MGQVLEKHYKTMTLDPEMKEAFPEGIQVGYRRYRNIKEQDFMMWLKGQREILLLVGRNARKALEVQPQGKFLKLQI